MICDIGISFPCVKITFILEDDFIEEIFHRLQTTNLNHMNLQKLIYISKAVNNPN